MSKYLLVYAGGGMPESDAEREAVMKAWDGWFHQLGKGLVDGGNPISASKKVSADGSIANSGGDATGYSIIEADSLDAATDLAKGCPVLQGGASVSVYETFEAM